MKRLIALLAATIAIAVLAPPSALAEPETTRAPATAYADPDAFYIDVWSFWSPNVCMAVGDSGIEAPYIAQQWNNKTEGLPAITASSNCVTAGFPASRRFTIETWNRADKPCWLVTDINGGYLDPGADGTSGNPHWWYTNNPITWVNTRCFINPSYKRHAVSGAIGAVMGLKTLDSSGYNSRVMCTTTWTSQNVPLPDSRSASVLNKLYGNVFDR